jgi:hypothetical protein
VGAVCRDASRTIPDCVEREAQVCGSLEAPAALALAALERAPLEFDAVPGIGSDHDARTRADSPS